MILTNDIKDIRKMFPVLDQNVGAQNRSLSYLDSAATSLMPQVVIEAMNEYETKNRSNIHRGIHTLAEVSTDIFETAREMLAEFLNVSPECLTMTHGTTESINIVAQGWAHYRLSKGDCCILFSDNHHANIVPWQMQAALKGFTITFIEVDEEGMYDRAAWNRALELKPSLVACTQVSNVVGQLNDINKIIDDAHKVGAYVLVDCAQSFGHVPLDITLLKADMAVGSFHKAYGPFGLGFLYCTKEIGENMHPVFGGGNMIETVTKEGYVPAKGSEMLEAGTPTISAASGLIAALNFIQDIGLEKISDYTTHLRTLAFSQLSTISNIQIFGRKEVSHASIVSFSFDDAHPHDIAAFLDREGIAVRAGHQCSMPFHEAKGIRGSVRASFGIFNSENEIGRLSMALMKMRDEAS